MQISVAMCTYNGRRFLPQQLESIAAQTRCPDELVVCDDGSTDETIEIVKAFSRRVSFPVQLEINETNLRPTKNFEKAIGFCKGEVIALSDQDDIWLPHKLRCIEDIFHREEAIGAVFSDAELIDVDSRLLGKTLWSSFRFSPREQRKFEVGEQLEVLLKHPVVTGATMAFRSEFRRLAVPIPGNYVHDYWISLLVASVSRLAVIRGPLIHYRRHADQQIGPGNWDKPLSELADVARRAGRDHYLDDVGRLNDLCERLCDCSGTFRPHANALRLISQKIKHRATRGRLPNSKVLRLPLLVREVATRRYWRYSNGFGSIAKDLLV